MTAAEMVLTLNLGDGKADAVFVNRQWSGRPASGRVYNNNARPVPCAVGYGCYGCYGCFGG